MANAFLNELLDGNIFDGSSDDEAPMPIERRFRDLLNPFSGFTDQDIYDRYRFYPPVILELTDMLKIDLERPTKKSRPLSPLHQVCIALRYLASNSFQQVCGDTFHVSQSTACRSLWRFCECLILHLDEFIKFPGPAQVQAMKDQFYEEKNLPNVVGLIDCTHVRIIAPTEHEEAFVNRKGFHSINVQAVVGFDGAFLHLNADLPGSVHDARILRSSTDLIDWLRSIPNGGHLLGDNGYACTTYLITPYRTPLTPAQRRYNKAHKETRVFIEQNFGWWKRRFSILHSETRLAPKRASLVIMVCGMLHNLAVRRNQPVIGEDCVDPDDDEQAENVNHGPESGAYYRDQLVEQFFH